MEKIWLKSYPPGVPAEINPDAYQSIIEMLDQSIQRYADKPAYYNLGVTLTFTQLDRLSRNFSAYLQQELNLRKGDRLAIMLPNCLQYMVTLLGAMRAGVIIVNVNPLYTADELTYQINNSGASALVVLSNFTDTVQQALPQMPTIKHVIITHLGDLFPPVKAWLTYLTLRYIYKKISATTIPNAIPFRQALSLGSRLAFQPVTITNQDIAFLQYTGGTTGVAKGAILTHRNMIANIQQADAWCRDLLKEGNEVILTAIPLYHIFSLLANGLFFMKLGALNVLITNPRDMPSMLKEMRRFKFTAMTGVNTLFNALLQQPEFAKLDFSRLHTTLSGGMAVQKAVAEKWKTVTGTTMLEGYGLTETSPLVTIDPINLKTFNGSIGLPVSSTDLAILDDHGQEVPLGEMGEIGVKGPQVMQGYWGNPKETANVFTPDGWLLTGDMAKMDAMGFVRILERKKDMILVSGFNVYPNEVEDVLVRLPGVRECAVIGIEDDRTGEAVKAYVVRNDPNLTPDQVTKHCRQHLTSYKVPKLVEFCQDLPKSNVGKILRRVLREANKMGVENE